MISPMTGKPLEGEVGYSPKNYLPCPKSFLFSCFTSEDSRTKGGSSFKAVESKVLGLLSWLSEFEGPKEGYLTMSRRFAGLGIHQLIHRTRLLMPGLLPASFLLRSKVKAVPVAIEFTPSSSMNELVSGSC